MKTVYLDNAATTRLDPSVITAMQAVELQNYANASSIHTPGQQSRMVIESAREIVAQYIRASAKEIIFTSGGTESNNLAIIGAALSNRNNGNHIITTSVEHPSVFNACKFLETLGFEVSYLKVDINCNIDLTQLEKLIRNETILVSVMIVNNEIGNIFPIKEIGQILHKKNITFHCDAIQALGKMDLLVSDFKIDLMSFSAHKIYGPKGVGALYCRTGTKIQNLFYGGAQEKNLRPGTENLVGIAGFAEAVELLAVKKEDQKGIKKLRDYFEEKLCKNLPQIRVNCKNSNRVFSISNVYFPDVPQDSMLLNLDLEGIACSGGSACSSGSLNPSHVLQSMNFGDDRAGHSLRFSFGRFNTFEDVEYTTIKITEIYNRLQRK